MGYTRRGASPAPFWLALKLPAAIRIEKSSTDDSKAIESRGSGPTENPRKTGPKISSQTAFGYPAEKCRTRAEEEGEILDFPGF